MTLRSLFISLFMTGSLVCHASFVRAQEGTHGFLAVLTAHDLLKVFVDGEVVGFTPLTPIRLTSGDHTVTVEHPELGSWTDANWRQAITVVADETTKVDVLFEFSYRIASRPFGAALWLDGLPAGETPMFIRVREDKRRLVTLKYDGFADSTFVVGETLREQFAVELKKKPLNIAGSKPITDFLEPTSKRKYDNKFWTSVGVSVISGAMALYFRNKADNSYDQYLSTGDPVVFNRHFKDAEKFDRFAAASFAVFQVSFAFSFYFYLTQTSR